MPSSRARARYKQVAEEFAQWHSRHKNAELEKKIKKFDQLADIAFVRDQKAMEDEINKAA